MKKPVRLLLLLGAMVAVFGIARYFSADHQAFLDFSARRDAWHAKCDEFRKVPLAISAEARSCNSQLEDLMVEARAHGWTR